MDRYTIDESQYKNGYEKGYEDGKKDVVEVVRCKDCIHENMTTCPLCWIEKHTMEFINHGADDFCSFGERKENEQT